MNKSICIILARGGSKRIPKKNIKPFFGKPIIEYSIMAAKESDLFEEVIVSTDDKEIADISKKCGASVPFYRSKKNSDDFSTTYDVIKEVLSNLKIEYEYVCCLYACAPFITGKKLRHAYEKLLKLNLDCVFPIIEYSFPIQRALKCDNDKVSFCYLENSLTRSQDLEKTYHDAGQFYFLKTKKCMLQEKIITNNSGYIVINEMEGQDIDNITDWKLAELKYEILQKS